MVGPINTSPSYTAAKERQAKAVSLRTAGLTYQQIADALNYGSHSAAQKAIQSGLKSIVREPATELVTLECERLDKIIQSHWSAMTKGHVRSTEVIIKAMERRAQMLGIDAPKDMKFSGELGIRQYVGIDPGDV